MTKKISFILILVFFAYLVIEILGMVSYYVVFQELYSKKQVKKLITQILEVENVEFTNKSDSAGDVWVGNQVEVIHPYFGYFRDPERNQGITNQGFPSYQKKQDLNKKNDQINIAVFGGSFAKGTYFLGIEDLKKCFKFANKKVNIVNFAIGGYKQPQQLMVLNYLILMGAHFDIVINIDGFNEVALPFVENIKNKVSPFYPRNWLYRARDINDPVITKITSKIYFLTSVRRVVSRSVKEYKLYRSPTLTLIWRIIDNSINLRLAMTQDHLKEAIGSKNLGFAVKGPEYRFDSKEGMYDDLADVWMRSSISMKYLCDSYRIKYFHFIQPNQYDPDSKKFTSKERKIAFDPGHPYRNGVLNGYPKLRERGKQLIENGVNFKDLTYIFNENEELLYSDTCCHLNEQGYKLIVEKICEFIHNNE
ncbi:hypothetical protein MTBBW1_2030074 [Desulfamplus magnetovallimortis]|uniref:Uncharacterized protein n=1 Tax=Desulfamplus magnetovallimortis TaxID=1246637 RepID=A0A1W1HBW2_9BACT|nr:hypothetical protein [Desulfamplus magnetovallimortis]SLM29984.1 hypothetical protein MTBBW1_2030074 [Desulfamplus magnetovallimortis]